LRAWLGFLKRAALLGLRSDVFAAWSHTPYRDIDALAEVPARVTPAGTIDGRREVRRNESRSSVFARARWKASCSSRREVLNANLPVHEIMDAGDTLDVVIQASDILAATQGSCFFAVLGHYVPVETRIGVVP